MKPAFGDTRSDEPGANGMTAEAPSPELLHEMDANWRAANYLPVAAGLCL